MKVGWAMVHSVAVLSASCGGGPTPSSGPIIIDSAGVRIVTNELSDVPVRTLDPVSMVEIGSVTDSIQSLFQVAGAVRLSDGRIAVANGGTHEIRFFDETGAFVSSVGREGAGPGEYGYMIWLTTCGSDSLYVYDAGRRRLTILTGEGETVGTSAFMLPDNIRPYDTARCQPSGPFVTAGWAQRGRAIGPHRPPMPVGLVALDGSPRVLFGEFPGVDRWGTAYEGQAIGIRSLPMGRSLSVAIGADQVFVGTGDAYEIQVYGLDGGLSGLFRLNAPRLPLTADDITRFVEDRVSDVADPVAQRRRRRIYADMEFLSEFPAYADIRVGTEGNLWVQDYPRPGAAEVAWRQFTTRGEYVGVLNLPARLELFEIGTDWVLGLVRDDLDVEYVRMFRIVP